VPQLGFRASSYCRGSELARGDYECGVGMIRREHITGTDYLDIMRLTVR
jgi:hypothetical protein